MPVIATAVATALATAAEKLVGLSQKLDELKTKNLLQEHIFPIREEILRVKDIVFDAKQAQADETAKLKQEHAESEAALEKKYVARILELEKTNAALVAEHEKLVAANQPLALDDTKIAILVLLGDGHERLSCDIAAHLNVSEECAKFHLHELAYRTPPLIDCSAIAARGVPNKYSIIYDGRRYLVEHGHPL